MSFTNKVVIVTGGSAGIGAATVVQFAREGAKVVIVGRNEEKLKKVGEDCRALNADYLIVKADITDDNEVKNIVTETIKKYGKLDILVNNAGILGKASILDDDMVKTYDEIINTNLRSVVVLSSVAAPYIVETRGNIVNISSIAGSRVRNPGFAAYSISKAGLNMFTMGLALELACHGVRVNTVSPGPVKTDIVKSSGINASIEDFKFGTALDRISETEEIADLILFLASDKAKGITGSNFISDNGSLVQKAG